MVYVSNQQHGDLKCNMHVWHHSSDLMVVFCATYKQWLGSMERLDAKESTKKQMNVGAGRKKRVEKFRNTQRNLFVPKCPMNSRRYRNCEQTRKVFAFTQNRNNSYTKKTHTHTHTHAEWVEKRKSTNKSTRAALDQGTKALPPSSCRLSNCTQILTM